MKNKLKELRIAAGLTQDQLGEKIGVCKQYISGWENGKRPLENARAATLIAICNALDCQQNDLFAKADFEYEDGKLIVDGLYYDPRYVYRYVVDIQGDYYLLPREPIMEKLTGEQLTPIAQKLSPDAMPEADYVYFLNKLVPRNGFDIKLGRAITKSEFAKLKARCNLTENDISAEVVDTIGAIYGEKYAKTFTAVQIRVAETAGVEIEQELRDKGIQADNVAPGRINIRVK